MSLRNWVMVASKRMPASRVAFQSHYHCWLSCTWPSHSHTTIGQIPGSSCLTYSCVCFITSLLMFMSCSASKQAHITLHNSQLHCGIQSETESEGTTPCSHFQYCHCGLRPPGLPYFSLVISLGAWFFSLVTATLSPGIWCPGAWLGDFKGFHGFHLQGPTGSSPLLLPQLLLLPPTLPF